MSSEVAIAVDGLSKSYAIRQGDQRADTLVEVVGRRLRHPLQRGHRERFWALQDVSFEVSRGEILGIIGRNGAGKSTTLKILSRITEPTKGEIRIRGRVGSLLEVGTGFHPELTGRENVYLNGSIIGMTRARVTALFDEIVAFAGIEEFLDVPVKRYSSGMSVRLAFAVAAHLEPEVLLLDEVLAVGDAEFQKKCLGKMGDVANRDARTVVFVSHNMAAIEALCTRCLLFEHGRIVYDGDPTEAISQYLAAAQETGFGERPGEFELKATPSGRPAIIRRLTLRNDEGETTPAIRMGSGVSVTMDLEGYRDVPNANVGLQLYTDLGQRICSVGTWMRPAQFEHEGAHHERLTFDLTSLPLTPGRYWITVWVWDGRDNRPAQEVERAAYVDVEQADLLGSGHPFSHAEGLVFVDFTWRQERDERAARASAAIGGVGMPRDGGVRAVAPAPSGGFEDV
jgi:lipopolysaccharide transport system ATP-binding protein